MRLPISLLLHLVVGLLALAWAGCGDVSISSEEAEPEASIIEPAPDAMFREGDPIVFRGVVGQRRTANEDLEVTWSSSRDGVLEEAIPDEDGATAFTTDEISAGAHTITLRVVTPEGGSATDAVGITVEVGETDNTAPTCAVTVPADDATLPANQSLVLEGTAGDAESAADELSARWSSSADGSLGATSPSSSGAIALPIDGLSAGVHVLTLDVDDPDGGSCSEFVVVTVEPENWPPSIGAPAVTPDPLRTADTATCTVPAPTDPEGDAVTVSVSWIVNASDPGVSGPTLDSSRFVKGDAVSCVATPSDATGAGTPAPSATLLVADSPPSAPGVTIDPTAPAEGEDDLICQLASSSLDADLEPITYSIAWQRNGSPWSGGTSTTSLPGDTIAAAETSAADTWICSITPAAAGVDGPAGSAAVTIGSPPVAGKLVFVTSTQYSGNLGGIPGANLKCQTRANAAGLTGTFLAWISAGSTSSSPASRFAASSVPYVRTDGVQIAPNWAGLTDGAIDAPIIVNEYGLTQTSPSFVYSFTQTNGTQGLFGSSGSNCYGGDCHCNGWTTTATQGSPTPGSAVAQVSQTNDDWTDYSFGNFCGGSYGLYCFQQ